MIWGTTPTQARSRSVVDLADFLGAAHQDSLSGGHRTDGCHDRRRPVESIAHVDGDLAMTAVGQVYRETSGTVGVGYVLRNPDRGAKVRAATRPLLVGGL